MLVIQFVLWRRPLNLYLGISIFRFNHVLRTYMISITNVCLRSFKGRVEVT